MDFNNIYLGSIYDNFILKPIGLDNKLLAHIVYNENILFNLKQCEKIFFELPNSKVKSFLLEELNHQKIIVCAEVKEHLINNYLDKVSKLGDFKQKSDITLSGVISKTICTNVNSGSNYYNQTSLPLDFRQVIYTGGYFLKSRHNLYIDKGLHDKKVIEDKVDFDLLKNRMSYILSSTSVRNIVKSRHVNRVGFNVNCKFIHLSKLVAYLGGNRFELVDFNKEWNTVKTHDYLDSQQKLRLDSNFELYLAGCYVIIFDNIFYLYIGCTTNLVDRAKYHQNNIKKMIKNLDFTNSHMTKHVRKTKLNQFIESEITSNGFLTYKILPLYYCCNYLKKFKLLYPNYKLSKGEFILLSSITDLQLKTLEMSLINCFNPKLELKETKIKPLVWHKSYLDDYCYKAPTYKSIEDRSLNTVYRPADDFDYTTAYLRYRKKID